MPVAIVVEFSNDGLLKEFLQIGRGGFLGLELKGEEQQYKEKKENVYHMPGTRKEKKGSGLNSRSLKESISMSWLELKVDVQPWQHGWLPPPPLERFRHPEPGWCISLGPWQRTRAVGQRGYPSVWPMT